MARLKYLDKSDLAEKDQDLLARNINLFRALVHSPNAARAFSGLGGFIRHQSKADPRLRELAILQVGWLSKSPYEWSHHIKIGYDFGVTDDDIRGLIDDTAGKPTALDETTKLVLQMAREMTLEGGGSEASFTALGTKMSSELLLDLTMTIAFYNAVVRVLATLQIDVEPEYMPYLVKFPLPK